MSNSFVYQRVTNSSEKSTFIQFVEHFCIFVHEIDLQFSLIAIFFTVVGVKVTLASENELGTLIHFSSLEEFV